MRTNYVKKIYLYLFEKNTQYKFNVQQQIELNLANLNITEEEPPSYNDILKEKTNYDNEYNNILKEKTNYDNESNIIDLRAQINKQQKKLEKYEKGFNDQREIYRKRLKIQEEKYEKELKKQKERWQNLFT